MQDNKSTFYSIGKIADLFLHPQTRIYYKLFYIGGYHIESSR